MELRTAYRETICVRGDLSEVEVWRKIQRVGARPGDYKSETVATFQLRYLEDSQEIALLRSAGDGEWECVYSDAIQILKGDIES